MIRFCSRLLAVCLILIPLVAYSQPPRPQWIQCAEPASPAGLLPKRTWPELPGEGHLRHTTNIAKPVTSATLHAAGDGCFVDIYVNGQRLSELESFDPILSVDVTQMCVDSLLTVALELREGTARRCAAFVQLDIQFADGTQQRVVTNQSWLCHRTAPVDWMQREFDDSSWQPAKTLGEVDERLVIDRERGIDIDAAENYDQWKQALDATAGTDPGSFRSTPGFQIERLRSADADEDSWISLAVDPQGRLIVAKEKGGLLRMTLGDDGSVQDVKTVNDTMQECRGLLFVGNDLYVNANNSKGLYRLPATKDDSFAEPELIYASSGGVGHGRNDLALGPEGWIYSIHGDSVDLPTEGRDWTSPFRAARRGTKTSEGHWLRIDPATKQVEVLASGLRNPFGIAFNPLGDCFTYDADAEHDMGAPWYRPTRVSQLMRGGDYGWRGVTGKWPPYYPDHPDNTPPNLDIGKGSPTAVKFGTASNFPPRYRDALFILDWTYGRILAVHTLPRGSSYMMTAETFLQGRPLNVTDLDFGADGAMYLVTGGRQTQSALYRVRYTGPEVVAPLRTSQQTHRDKVAEASREILRELQSKPPQSGKGYLRWLNSNDPWIRAAARNHLEQIPVEQWRAEAFSVQDDRTALSMLMSLARHGDPDSRAPILKRLCEMDWPALSRSWRQTAVYTMDLCTTEQELEPVLAAELRSQLESVYPDREFSVNRVLSELLVRLNSESVVRETLALAASATVQIEQLHYLFAIRDAPSGWTLPRRLQYFQLLAQTTDYVGGQGMVAFLDQIRKDAIAGLTDEERQALAEVIDVNRSAPATRLQTIDQRPVVAQWTSESLATALEQLEQPGDAVRGWQMFATASCIDCHRVGGNGRLIGPDLTNVSRRFSQRDLLQAVLEPSQVIPEKYQAKQVLTSDGRLFTGWTALGGDYRSTKLRLATNPLDPYEVTEIDKQAIEEIRDSPTSWMPSGLLNTLTAKDIADLLAYLHSNGV